MWVVSHAALTCFIVEPLTLLGDLRGFLEQRRAVSVDADRTITSILLCETFTCLGAIMVF